MRASVLGNMDIRFLIIIICYGFLVINLIIYFFYKRHKKKKLYQIKRFLSENCMKVKTKIIGGTGRIKILEIDGNENPLVVNEVLGTAFYVSGEGAHQILFSVRCRERNSVTPWFCGYGPFKTCIEYQKETELCLCFEADTQNIYFEAIGEGKK